MPKLIEALHDEIDEEEALAERARGIVKDKSGKLVELLDELGDVEEALAALSALVEDELTDLTTEAVRFGRDATIRRDKVE